MRTACAHKPVHVHLRGRFAGNRSAVVGLVVLVMILLTSVLAPLIAAHSPTFIPTGQARLGPSGQHWFGTDQTGRDLFARVLYGGRTALAVGFGSVGIAFVVGVGLGVIGGYFGGFVDAAISRLTEVFLAFPSVLLAGILLLALGGGTSTIIVALAAVAWPTIARLTRATVRQAKTQSYVDVAKTMGAGNWYVIRRHVLPHALGPLIVVAASSVGTAILAQAALSFLGLGVSDSDPAWGLMVADGRRFLASAPHIVLFPGGAILLTVLALTLVVDGLQDALSVERK